MASINSLQATLKEELAPEDQRNQKSNYDKAKGKLRPKQLRKTAEQDDKEAKKKLVALTEQALTAIQEAKDSDAVDKAPASSF